MSEDDLDRPLGGRAPARRRLPRLDGMAILAGAVALALGVAGLWALVADDPLGGEPVAVAAIERNPPPRPAGQEPSNNASAEADKRPAARDGVPIVRPGDPMPKAGPVIIRMPGAEDGPEGHGAAGAGKPGSVETALLEETPQGALPRIGADGRRPLDVYGRAAPGNGPRIALILGGLGVGREATLTAIKTLPGEVTFAFSPYGQDVGGLVAKAREDGHEVLIQAPMEPFDYPANDPGPQTLLTALPASANLERLRWALGRASGYVGVAPLAGARFLQTEAALAPVFTELARRGLMFVTAAAGTESRATAVAEQSGLPHAGPARAVDQVQDAAMIDGALADLERDAKTRGFAVGWASASPLTLKRIEAWRAGLPGRGVTLAPVSAAAGRQGPS